MGNLRHLLLLLMQMTMSQEDENISCGDVLSHCKRNGDFGWTTCYEADMNRCRSRPSSRGFVEDTEIWDFYKNDVDINMNFERMSERGYALSIPPEALKRSIGSRFSEGSTALSLTLFNSSLFKAEVGENEAILGGRVLNVKVGRLAVGDLSEPVRISFIHANETRGRCVYYEEVKDGSGAVRWSTEGCNVSRNNKAFVCSCNHLSFFAVLVNQETLASIDPVNVLSLTYISYISCGLSVFFTALTILLHLCLRNFRRGRSDQSMNVHLNLTGALFSLHLFFLLSVMWAEVGLEKDQDGGVGGAICQSLGLLLHYSLLATFTWTSIEGFHLYLLLVRVFNVYIKRYLLKLALIGWGVPMVTVIACAFIQTYGRFGLQEKGTEICWITRPYVCYITVSGYLGLVFLFSVVMLCVMVTKLRKVRTKSVHHQEYKRMLVRDCLTILGMCCVLGVPWGLAFITYGPLPLPGLYLFTILNGLQGVFMFLWFMALTWKSSKDESSTGKDPSTQKIETSFNN